MKTSTPAPAGHRPRLAAVLAMALCSVLAACGPKEDPPAPHAAAPAASSPAGAVVAMARGIVEVPGGLLDLTAPADGTVESVEVRDGAKVKRGQVLLKLVSDTARADIAVAEAELAAARVRQRALATRLPAAKLLASRLAEAAQAQAVDAQRADDARQAVVEVESALSVAGAEVAVATQKAAQARNALSHLVLSAPMDAEVVALSVQAGSRVSLQNGRVLASLLPARGLQVRAELGEAYVSRVSPGMKATVQPEGDDPGGPAPLPQARVVRIAPLYGTGHLDDEAHARGNVRVVACFLEFEGPPQRMRVGQTVRVSFHE